MTRTKLIANTLLLVTSSIVHAADREAFPFDLGVEDQSLQRIDTNLSPREYDEICKHNQRVVMKNLRSYSESALESFGLPQQGISLMSATLGLALDEARLDLNESKTLSIGIKDMRNSDRAVFFGVNLDWK